MKCMPLQTQDRPGLGLVVLCFFFLSLYNNKLMLFFLSQIFLKTISSVLINCLGKQQENSQNGRFSYFSYRRGCFFDCVPLLNINEFSQNFATVIFFCVITKYNPRQIDMFSISFSIPIWLHPISLYQRNSLLCCHLKVVNVSLCEFVIPALILRSICLYFCPLHPHFLLCCRFDPLLFRVDFGVLRSSALRGRAAVVVVCR